MIKCRNNIRIILLLFFFVSVSCLAQDTMLCVGRHWTEDQANLMMKRFEKTWDDLESWEKRANMIREYPYIQKVYALYNAEHKVENAHFHSEKHDYGYSKRAAAYVFFKRHLKLDEDQVQFSPTIQEDFMTILPKDQLRVYTNENPLPDEALMGNRAVMECLGIGSEKMNY